MSRAVAVAARRRADQFTTAVARFAPLRRDCFAELSSLRIPCLMMPLPSEVFDAFTLATAGAAASYTLPNGEEAPLAQARHRRHRLLAGVRSFRSHLQALVGTWQWVGY